MFKCEVFAYVKKDGELMATMMRDILIPAPPYVGLVLEGEHCSVVAETVAYNYTRRSYTVLAEAEHAEEDSDIDEWLKMCFGDGFELRIDYRKESHVP